jgi:hypothetical protein
VSFAIFDASASCISFFRRSDTASWSRRDIAGSMRPATMSQRLDSSGE